jgi:DNA-binding winged helix-turn-helix (wHTH) protein/TolB-like protein
VQYRFGPFVADRAAYRVSRGAEALDLTPKLLDLLFFLLERPESLVTKEALLDGVWPGANVTDNALAQAMSDLRDALGDKAASPTYIRTVARRGYRFIASIEMIEPREASAPAAVRLKADPTYSVMPGPRGPGLQRDPTPDAAPEAGARAVAVLDFVNVTADPDVAWLGAGIAETVSNDLSALGAFRVIDRWRVVEAARETDGSLHATSAALGTPLMVTGSYQRHGPHLRITARVVDVAAGQVMADAKVDGPLADVFALQDEITAMFAHELGLARPAPARVAQRDTSSLDAYRASTEGWVKLESLNTSQTREAIADFERAIHHDPGYALAYTGLANAQLVAFEMSRASASPDADALASGIEHARRAIAIDPGQAEAHGTLSFLLASALEFDAARAAAQQAVAIDPDNWRHYYRLGHASWGSARVRALERAHALFPEFSYATLELAMVHVARGDLELAARTARHGAVEQDRQARTGHRFPAIGFHWLLGALEAAADRPETAIRHFDLERAQADSSKLYGPEYAAAALVGRGFALLDLERIDEGLVSFRDALSHVAGYPQARLGVAVALTRLGRAADASAAWRDVDRACDALDRTRRTHDARVLAACAAAAKGETSAAATMLHAMLDAAPVSHLGWTIPIEPCLRLRRPVLDTREGHGPSVSGVGVGPHASGESVRTRLAERAT